MLQVELDNILPEEDALQRIQEIFDHVEQQKEIYVITKGGRPVFAIVDIDHLEKDMNGLSMGTTTPSEPTIETAPPAPAPFPTPEPTTPAVPEVAVMENVEATLPTPPLAQEQPGIALEMTPEPQEAPAAPAPLAEQPMTGSAPSQPGIPQFSNVPPLTGDLDLPDMPSDPGNSSPLA